MKLLLENWKRYLKEELKPEDYEDEPFPEEQSEEDKAEAYLGNPKSVGEFIYRAFREELEKQPAHAAFGKRRKRTRFGEIFKNYPQFGKSSFGHSNYTPKQQVMNFGMTPKKAMEIIRKLYRKNCKNV